MLVGKYLLVIIDRFKPSVKYVIGSHSSSYFLFFFISSSSSFSPPHRIIVVIMLPTPIPTNLHSHHSPSLPPLYLIFPPSVPPHPPSPTPITTNVSLHHITDAHPNIIKLSSRHHHANNVSSLLHCRITIERVVTYRKASTSYSSFILLLLFLFLFFYSSFNPFFLNIQKNSLEFCDRKFVI